MPAPPPAPPGRGRAPYTPSAGEPRSLRVPAPREERRARGPGEQSDGGAGSPGAGRTERATRCAFVSGGAGAAVGAGRPERRMRRPEGRIEERCGSRRRGARAGAQADLCV